MNLELLDPFGRQVPDRVDATIQLADDLHFLRTPLLSSKNMSHDDGDNDVRTATQVRPQNRRQRRRSESDDTSDGKAYIRKNDIDRDDDEWKAAFHVAYNRRGNYIAVGYGSGTVAVFCTLTRTLSALYCVDNSHTKQNLSDAEKSTCRGCSSLSWSRRSRRLLAGNVGDTFVRLYDTSHPAGPEECASAAAILVSAGQTAAAAAMSTAVDADDADADSNAGEKDPKTRASAASNSIARHSSSFVSASVSVEIPSVHQYWQKLHSPFSNCPDDFEWTFVRKGRPIPSKMLESDEELFESLESRSASIAKRKQSKSSDAVPTKTKKTRYPCVTFDFPEALAGSLHIHPCYPDAGIAVLSSGILVLFWIPNTSFCTEEVTYRDRTKPTIDEHDSVVAATLFPMYTKGTVVCASFDPLGNRVYAGTKCGLLLGFDVSNLWAILFESQKLKDVPTFKPKFEIPLVTANRVSDGATSLSAIWHLLVSRNGKFLIVNTSDGTIRLYSTLECWSWTKNETASLPPKPIWVFQDVVTKVKFASCDLSGDGEYLVGGANGADNKYELHIWNTSTGALMDKLTGSSTVLYSVAWHPTRSFLAVACADGLVDVWGPRINWTAFAPDFQALPMNVEYIEREDEFDLDEHGRHLAEGYSTQNETSDFSGNMSTIVNVRKIERVPVFASDSESEEDVFTFETRVKNLLAGRAEKNSRKASLEE
jgi:WD40 repeat protein